MLPTILRITIYLSLIGLTYLCLGLGSVVAGLMCILLIEKATHLEIDMPNYLEVETTTQSRLYFLQRGCLFFLAIFLGIGISISYLAKLAPASYAIFALGTLWEAWEISLLFLTTCVLLHYVYTDWHILPSYISKGLLIGMVIFFMTATGEESQWGQPLLRLNTPAWLDHTSKHHHFNFHEWMPLSLDWEPFFGEVLQGFTLLYGIVLPLYSQFHPKVRATACYLRLPIIPIAFIPLLLIAALFIHPYVSAYWAAPLSTSWELSEAGELIIYGVACAVTVLQISMWKAMATVPIKQKGVH